MLMHVTFRPLPVRKKREAHVEHRERAGRDARATDDLQRHAADEQIPVGQEAPAEIAAEQVQAVVESAEHAHQHRGRFHAEMQMLRRVEDQRRVKDGEAERREDLNEEQHGRSLRSRGETAFERFHRAPFSLAAPANVKPPMLPGRKNRIDFPALTCRNCCSGCL